MIFTSWAKRWSNNSLSRIAWLFPCKRIIFRRSFISTEHCYETYFGNCSTKIVMPWGKALCVSSTTEVLHVSCMGTPTVSSRYCSDTVIIIMIIIRPSSDRRRIFVIVVESSSWNPRHLLCTRPTPLLLLLKPPLWSPTSTQLWPKMTIKSVSCPRSQYLWPVPTIYHTLGSLFLSLLLRFTSSLSFEVVPTLLSPRCYTNLNSCPEQYKYSPTRLYCIISVTSR